MLVLLLLSCPPYQLGRSATAAQGCMQTQELANYV